MSYELIIALDKKVLPELTTAERLVFTHLCIFARRINNFAYMSTRSLQKRTGITQRTNLNRTIRNLIEKKLIQRQNLTDKNEKIREGFVINLHLLQDQSDPPPKINPIHPLDQTDLIYNKGNKKVSKKGLADGETGVNKKMNKKRNNPNPYMNLSAKEIAENKIKLNPPKKKMNAEMLYNVWQNAHKRYYPDIYIGVWKKIEMGMFKSYIKFSSPEYCGGALLCVVQHWVQFVKFCEKHGAVSKPTTPKIKFILKYAPESVTFFKSKQTVITKVYDEPKVNVVTDGLKSGAELAFESEEVEKVMPKHIAQEKLDALLKKGRK